MTASTDRTGPRPLWMFRRSPPRLSTLALLAAQLLGLAGLYAADRAITQGARARVELDAAEAAALMEGFLAAHVQRLRAMRGVLRDTARSMVEARLSALLNDLVESRLLFRHIWVSDSTGIIRYERVLGTEGLSLGQRWDIDTTTFLQTASAAAAARQTRQPVISKPSRLATGEKGFGIVVPFTADDRITGFAGGVL